MRLAVTALLAGVSMASAEPWLFQLQNPNPRAIAKSGFRQDLRTVSGIGVEDVFYDETRKQPARETRYRLKFLRKFIRAKKTVLSVDYVDTGRRADAANQARIADFVSLCEAEGFDFYAARKDRELDRINAISGVQP